MAKPILASRKPGLGDVRCYRLHLLERGLKATINPIIAANPQCNQIDLVVFIGIIMSRIASSHHWLLIESVYISSYTIVLLSYNLIR